jgi:hypothetical protein
MKTGHYARECDDISLDEEIHDLAHKAQEKQIRHSKLNRREQRPGRCIR